MFKNRKNNKKGFTLVEVIVVLVILAILAAIMIPALTGWIEKANKKTAVVEARSVLLAMQTVASENYPTAIVDSKALKSPYGDEVKNLAEVTGTISDVTISNKSKVETFKFATADGKYTVTYDGKKFTVA